MMIEMKVDSLTVDPFNNAPSLLLIAPDGQTISVAVGMNDTSAITAALADIPLDRPIAHDLLKTMLAMGNMTVDRVEVHNLQTRLATIHVRRADGTASAIDARPSDAIALALRTRTPIYVAQKIVDKARQLDMAVAAVDSREILARLSETAFGKWKM